MITVKNISKEFISAKKYPGFKGAIKGVFSREKVKTLAVDNISFEIAKGEIVGYIGSNGAGKSTTIKMMTGIISPTSGVCIVDGVDPSKNRKLNAKNIGVVFGQRTQLWWDLPLSESFSILKEIYLVSDEDYKKRMKFLNDVLDLDKFMHNSVRTLSLGQRMRADLAAALIHNPKVLYLDEPTIGLDVVVKEKIRQAIKEINKKFDTTVILTTHDLGDIEELCNRIIIIDMGKIIYNGTLNDLKEKYGINRTIEFDIKDIEEVSHKDYNKIFNVDKKNLMVSTNKNKVSITFNKNRINVADIIENIMKDSEIRDIKLQETEISEIVKGIYVNKLNKEERICSH